MNAISSVVTNKYFASSLCLLGGYALNSVSLGANRFAVKQLGISAIDILEGKEYPVYSWLSRGCNFSFCISLSIRL